MKTPERIRQDWRDSGMKKIELIEYIYENIPEDGDVLHYQKTMRITLDLIIRTLPHGISAESHSFSVDMLRSDVEFLPIGHFFVIGKNPMFPESHRLPITHIVLQEGCDINCSCTTKCMKEEQGKQFLGGWLKKLWDRIAKNQSQEKK